MMAFLLVHLSWSPAIELVLLILASSSLYLAGMVLNDLFDYEIDLQQRPSRPLPAKLITKRAARIVGLGLLVSGVLIACAAGWVGSQYSIVADPSLIWRPGAIALLLAILILLYDGPMKKTIAAPFLMGGCRTLNILLGASTFSAVGLMTKSSWTESLFLGFPAIIWWIAVTIGLLITGATLLGRNEATEKQNRVQLVFGGAMIIASLTALALVAYCPPSVFELTNRQKEVFPLFIGIISLTIFRRVVEAIVAAKPAKIQLGVISVLRSLIIFDAAICYLAAPQQMGYALAVLMLLIPTLVLGRFISST